MGRKTLKIAVLGPTGSGKSDLAVALARRLGCAVVNGDPFQAMAGLEIGTGQPSREERQGVLHLGYGALTLHERPNPASFGIQVRAWLQEAGDAVLVTGSGLFLRGIWDQLDTLPEPGAELVAKVRGWGHRLGIPALHRYLAAVDPVRAGDLHPNDGSRVQRALCLHLATGRPPSALLTGIRRGVPEGWRGLIVQPDREALMARIARRVVAMARAGWAQEVERIRAAGLDQELRALRPLGYLDWLDEPRGAEARIIKATQAYAKRQLTFFRNQWPELPCWDPEREGLEEALRTLGL